MAEATHAAWWILNAVVAFTTHNLAIPPVCN